MTTWEPDFHAECERLVEAILSNDGDGRTLAWGELFARLTPHLEKWARNNSTLRRAGLTSEDDWRAVFVRAVERMVKHDFKNLRAYRDNCEARRLDGTLGPTPLEGWLRQLVKYAARDELSRFLAVKRIEPSGGAHTLEGLAGRRHTGRSLVSEVDRRRRSDSIVAALRALPEDQKCALAQRLLGASYDDIATVLAITAARAQRLVRSAKATLRRSLRDSRPTPLSTPEPLP